MGQPGLPRASSVWHHGNTAAPVRTHGHFTLIHTCRAWLYLRYLDRDSLGVAGTTQSSSPSSISHTMGFHQQQGTKIATRVVLQVSFLDLGDHLIFPQKMSSTNHRAENLTSSLHHPQMESIIKCII